MARNKQPKNLSVTFFGYVSARKVGTPNTHCVRIREPSPHQRNAEREFRRLRATTRDAVPRPCEVFKKPRQNILAFPSGEGGPLAEDEECTVCRYEKFIKYATKGSFRPFFGAAGAKKGPKKRRGKFRPLRRAT